MCVIVKLTGCMDKHPSRVFPQHFLSASLGISLHLVQEHQLGLLIPGGGGSSGCPSS